MKTSTETTYTTHSTGFQMLDQFQRLRIQLAASGEAGMQSLMYACISAGINTDEAIYDQIADLLGESGVNLAKKLLDQNERVTWVRGCDDTYTVIHG